LGGEGPKGPELVSLKAEGEGTPGAEPPTPEGETYGNGPPKTDGKGPPPQLQEAYVRATRKVELSLERRILDAMGKDTKDGEGVRTQWYNFARGKGATAEEAEWSARGNIST